MKKIQPLCPAGFSIHSPSAKHTQRIAACLLQYLAPPVTLALEGDLGAGKTCFVAALVEALDPSLSARSPTYALAHTYRTSPVIHHVDLYRVQDQDLEDLGIETLLEDPDAIICMEWPSHRSNPLPAERVIQIVFEVQPHTRTLKFSFSKAFETDWVLTLRENLLSVKTEATRGRAAR